jgi:rhamnosyltransferase
MPTKNGGELLKQVLDGLRKQTCWAEVQLIVVDSGSSDETVRLASDAGARIHLLPAAQFNHGATRDLGISLADSERVVLMVQDAVPQDSHLLERLVSALEEPGVAGAYARQLPRPEADVLVSRNLNGWLTGRLQRERRQLGDAGDYLKLSPIEKYFFCNFDNVCSAINKSVWQEMKFGAVDFGEDIDWAERALQAGYAIVYEPEAAVVHSHARPLAYEYKRTYLCHRKLFRQFGLRLIPGPGRALIAWLHGSWKDMLYVARHEENWSRKLRLMARVPALNLASVLGQYRGANDGLAGIGRKIEGV